MKKSIIITAIFALSMIASSIYASSLPISTQHFVNLHFSDDYYGEEVESVMAHIGIVMEGTGHYESIDGDWFSVQDVHLEKSETGFAAKTVLESGYNTNRGGQTRQVSMGVVYFVKLKNQKEIVTQAGRHGLQQKNFLSWTDYYYGGEESKARYSKKYCSLKDQFATTSTDKIAKTEVSVTAELMYQSTFDIISDGCSVE